ncbi:site-2 protease family protein [Verrucomicrobiota bacterium]
MTSKDIRRHLCHLPKYSWFIFILFLWYFLFNVSEVFDASLPAFQFHKYLKWISTLLVSPFLMAGILGSIIEYLQYKNQLSSQRFFRNGLKYYLYFIGVDIFLVVFAVISVLVINLSGLTIIHPESKTFAVIRSIISIIKLFWISTIVTDHGKIGRSLTRGIRILFSNPMTIAIGIVWGALIFADSYVANFINKETTAALTGITAGIMSFAAVIAYLCVITVCRKSRTEIFREASENVPPPLPASTRPGEKPAKVGFVLAFLSFLPVLNIVALVLGIIALKRKTHLKLKALTATCLGGFFTALYIITISGHFMSSPTHAASVGYEFLSEADSDLHSLVPLLNNGAVIEAREEFEQITAQKEDHSWPVLCASAIITAGSGNAEKSLSIFNSAAEKNPDKGEFYYYYGYAQLSMSLFAKAEKSFKLALKQKPGFREAEMCLGLTQNVYEVSPAVSAAGFVVILLFLFTFHEFAHAYSAWKLGDHTAKDQGRLSLNPIVHIDPIGSLLLPGILLWRQSDVIFGWAKPVPVDPRNFKDPRRDHMIVSFAGPAMNLFISMISLLVMLLFLLFIRILSPGALTINLATPFSPISIIGTSIDQWLLVLITFLKQLLYTSLVLGCFNLIPIPPLDGSWILSGFLSERSRVVFEKIRPFSFIIFLAIVMTPALDFLLIIPVGLAWWLMYFCFSAMGFN